MDLTLKDFATVKLDTNYFHIESLQSKDLFKPAGVKLKINMY